MKKRILSILLAAIMVFSLLPVTVFAEECIIYVSASGSDATGTGAADAPFATIQKAIDSIPNSGTVILLSDLNVSTAASNNYAFEILGGKDITLDGGGYKVKMNNAVRPFCVSAGKLTLTDVDIDMNGHQYNQLDDGKYTIQVLQDGELVLNDGAIIENAKYGDGFTNFSIRGTATMNDGAIIRNMEGLFGAIRVEGYDDTSGFGNFYMNGGLITGCTSESDGYEGVVFYISVGGKMVMTGGTITGNQNKADSPGTIFLHANNMGARGYNEFTATGGTITGNSAIYGGVVYTDNNKNKINISGNVNFTGNTGTEFGGESNLYLGDDLLVNLEGGMGENSMVGVYTSSVPSNTADVKFAFNAAKADAGHFISDKMSTSGIIYDDGEKCWNAAGNEIVGYHHVNEANTLWLSTAAAGYAVDISSEIENGTVTPNLKCFCPGDTVTLTVNPATGYQLKSLTVTPVAPTISTIADVLATVEGFPEDTAGGTYPVTPSGAWSNGNGGFAFIYSNAFILMKDGYTYGQLSTKVKKEENCYTATISYGSLTFNMENGILTSFEFTADPSKPNAANYVGTYTPASTPSAKLKPITPEKQTDGTYQFEMPAANVTVTAEFEVAKPDYLSVTNTGTGDAKLKWAKSGSPTLPTLWYSTDGVNFYDVEIGKTAIPLAQGNTVYFKGDYTGAEFSSSNYIRLSCTGTGAALKLGGDLTTLLDGKGNVSSLAGYTDYLFKGLFYNLTALTDASALKLPSVTLKDYCYRDMFYGCKSLENAPALPATALAVSCYGTLTKPAKRWSRRRFRRLRKARPATLTGAAGYSSRQVIS